MTKRNGGDEQVWLLMGDDGGVLETVKKGRRAKDEDYDSIIEEEDDEDGRTVDDLNASDSVNHEVYIDQSELVDEHENSEIDQEEEEEEEEDGDSDGGANNIKEQPRTINVDEEDPTAISAVIVKWTDQATCRLLDLLDQVVAKETEVPSKNDRVWIRIARDMKPFYFTADECYKKFLYLRKTYRKALGRMASNQPYKWRHFNRMCTIMGDTGALPPPAVTGNQKMKKPEPLPSTSAVDMYEEDDPEEIGLSKFDQLLKRKKEMLVEVRHQGEVLEKHVEECLASTIRRENRENQMIQLLTELKSHEQKKLDLFKKLLDKLWYVLIHNSFTWRRYCKSG